MGSNTHGNKNEIEITNSLNGKHFNELSLNLKEFVRYICKTKKIQINDNSLVLAEDEKNKHLKQDIYVTIEGKKVGVSLKMGTGNSCHQEKIEDFIIFIMENCDATDEMCNLWRFFIWADGSLDGSGPIDKDASGKIKSRFNSSEFKEKFPKERKKMQAFLDKNKEKLIRRALFAGKHNSNVDFVYHGTHKQGRWISKEEIINFLLKKELTNKNACFTLGSLTVQAWNISSKGNTEKKRGQIQLKYSSMVDDFDAIMKSTSDTTGTFFGDLGEFDLTRIMNKQKNSPMWKTLLPSINDYSNFYLVKVSTNQPSKLSGKKVKTKSDVYAIKSNIERKYLLSREYVLDESDIKSLTYVIVPNTGISIKVKNSKNYTYQKFTKASFCKAFSTLDDPEFWMSCLLVYSSEKDRHKNEKIISDLGNDYNTFLNKVKSIIGIEIDFIDNKKFWDDVRKMAQEKICQTIKNDIKLYENIFTGRYWFDSPYHADYIYEKGQLRKNIITTFTITTGSGRSKGKYTIEIKPSNQ